MKKIFLFSFFLILVFDGFSQPKKFKLYGTWVLESSIFTTEDNVYREYANYKKEMKIITPGYFIFIINKTSDNSFIMSSDGRPLLTEIIILR